MATRKPTRRAAQFWRRMSENYGTRLTEHYGETIPSDWREFVDRTDPESLDLAIANIRVSHPSHPPTLGEFIAAIPRRRIDPDENLIDRLAQHAVATFRLCRHQLCRPWSYFGRTEEVPTARGFERVRVTRGVVIPGCSCSEGGNPGYRLLVRDLPPRPRLRPAEAPPGRSSGDGPPG